MQFVAETWGVVANQLRLIPVGSECKLKVLSIRSTGAIILPASVGSLSRVLRLEGLQYVIRR